MTTATHRLRATFSAIFQWRSLKTRVIIFVLAIFLIGIWALAFYVGRILHEDMEHLLGEQQFSTVSFVAEEVNAEFGARVEALKTIAERITPGMIRNPASLQTMLEDQPIFYSLFNNGVAVAGLDGTVIAEFPHLTGRLGANFKERDYIIGPLTEGKVTIGRPVMSKLMHAPAFVIGAPIRDTQGNVIGVIGGVTDLHHPNFLEKVTENRYGKTGGYLLLAPRHKLIITGTDKSRIMQPFPAPGINPLFDRYVQGFEGSGVIVGSGGLEGLSSAKQIPVAGWIIVAGIPTEEAFAPIRAMKWRVLLATIFLTLLAAGLTWWLLKRQLAPIFTTIKTLAALTATDQPLQPLPITRQDEIGELIGGFNRLLETLRTREEALRQAHKQLTSLFNGTRDAILIADISTGLILDANDEAAILLNLSKENLIGLHHTKLHPPDKADFYRKRFLERSKMVNPGHVEAEVLTSDGRRVSVEISARSIELLGGKRTMVSIFRDITERKRAEEALRESEEKYRTILEDMEDSYHEVDLEGNFTFFNEPMCKMLGYEREELLGLNNRQYADEENANKVYQAYNQVYRTGKSIKNFEWQVIRKDGARRDVEVSISLIRNGEGHPTGFRGIVRDTTDRKHAEEERRNLEERLQRAEKMEALGQLAGGVAHDLNNVLGILSGYSELLLEEIPEGSRSRGHAEKILQSTEKGAAIIQDLLTLARRGVTVSDVIHLNRVVSDFLKTPVFERLKDFNPRVTFRTECDPNLLNIKGSPVHMEKTLINLVSNAVESISGAGEVTIRTESRYLDKPLRGYDEVKEGDYVVLIVSDTGMGIPAENREKIFEPFYTKKTMGRSGTGLGLAIVWGTVKDHNGYIDVQTEVGEGTTFTLYFPVTREEMTAPQRKAPIEQYTGNGESVLVVDDVAGQRDIAAGLLTRLGYRVHAVSSGEEAVEYLKENQADILVLDMIMPPGIDGLETYRRVLEVNPKQKAILVSGFSETERVRETQKLGAGAYVKKPYIMEKIGVAIRDELDRV